MKTIQFFLILFILPLWVAAQKNVNGKVYDKHPAIEITNAFNDAYVSGDVDKLKSLVSEDFKMWDMMTNNPNYKIGDFNTLLGQVNFIKNNLVHASITNRGSAYSDAIEYKKDGLHVLTYQLFTAWDKDNGFKIKTPRNSTFIFNEEGTKIRRLLWEDNKAAWQKWNLSRETIKNGTLYKDHPLLAKVRKVYYNLERGNIEETFKDFSENARIYDSNLIDKEFVTLAEHKENANSIFSMFEILSLDEVGYPDYLDYEGSGGVSLSWMKFTLKNKKTGKIINMPVHSQMWFNEEGTIMREDLYYNANLLN